MSDSKDCTCQEINARHCLVHNESDDKPAREFWISEDRISSCDCINEGPGKPNIADCFGPFKVIEHSAYLALQKENAELKAALGEAIIFLERQYTNCVSPSGTARDAELDEVLAKLKKRWP